MRENAYLITALLLLAMIGVYFFRIRVAPILRRRQWDWATMESLAFGGIIALVFVFLRPIVQFIYFQF